MLLLAVTSAGACSSMCQRRSHVRDLMPVLLTLEAPLYGCLFDSWLYQVLLHLSSLAGQSGSPPRLLADEHWQ